VDEGTLGVHEIELVVNLSQGLSNGGVVGNHAAGTLGLGNVSSGDLEGSLGVDSALESGRTPVNELNSGLVLDGGHGGLDIGRSDVTTVHETTGHELSVSGVALGEEGVGLGHDRSGQFRDGEGLVVGLSARHEGCVSRDEHVETGVWYKYGGSR